MTNNSTATIARALDDIWAKTSISEKKAAAGDIFLASLDLLGDFMARERAEQFYREKEDYESSLADFKPLDFAWED